MSDLKEAPQAFIINIAEIRQWQARNYFSPPDTFYSFLVLRLLYEAGFNVGKDKELTVLNIDELLNNMKPNTTEEGKKRIRDEFIGNIYCQNNKMDIFVVRDPKKSCGFVHKDHWSISIYTNAVEWIILDRITNCALVIDLTPKSNFPDSAETKKLAEQLYLFICKNHWDAGNISKYFYEMFFELENKGDIIYRNLLEDKKDGLLSELSLKERDIAQREMSVSQKEENITAKEKNIHERESNIALLEQRITEREVTIDKRERQLIIREKESALYLEKRDELKNAIEARNAELLKREATLLEREKIAAENKKALKVEYTQLETKKASLSEEYKKLNAQKDKLKRTIDNAESEISNREKELASREEALLIKEQSIDEN